MRIPLQCDGDRGDDLSYRRRSAARSTSLLEECAEESNGLLCRPMRPFELEGFAGRGLGPKESIRAWAHAGAHERARRSGPS